MDILQAFQNWSVKIELPSPNGAVLPVLSVFITASISSFTLRTSEFSVVASSLPYLLLAVSDRLSSLSPLISVHSSSVCLHRHWHVLVDYLTVSSLSSWQLDPQTLGRFDSASNLEQISILFGFYPSGSRPFGTLMLLMWSALHPSFFEVLNWSASPLFSGFHPSLCEDIGWLSQDMVHPLIAVSLMPQMSLLI